MANHWNEDGDLVIEDKTLFRHVGWLGYSGHFYGLEERIEEVAGFSPIYQQVSTWEDGVGWRD